MHLCRDDKFRSVAWGIYFHSTSLLPRLRNKASGPSLPVTLEVLHLWYIWWNSMRQWKFTRCCRKKQGKVKAQPRKIKWVLFACTFIDFWQPCYSREQQKGKEFRSLNGWVIYYPPFLTSLIYTFFWCWCVHVQKGVYLIGLKRGLN